MPVPFRLPKSRFLYVAALSALFACSFSQEPLFSGNQNTYFLSGLARAGYGFLSADWLARQTDPVPLFSMIVFLVQSFGSSWMYYVLNGALAAIFGASLFAIAMRSSRTSFQLAPAVLFFALLALACLPWEHSPFWEMLPKLWGINADIEDLARALTNGVAYQRVPARTLQPSAFGVLLVASLALFVWKREYLAVVCAVAAASIHTSLIFHAGILTAGYSVALLLEKKPGKAIKISLLALALVTPVVFYVTSNFVLAEAPQVRNAASYISVRYRQPFHTLVSVWFSGVAFAQIVIAALGIALSRAHARLFATLLTCALIAAGLSVVQAASGSRTLALLYPWRTSVWLIPVCTAIGFERLSRLPDAVLDKRCAERLRGDAKALALALFIGLLVFISALGFGKTVARILDDRDGGTVMEYARSHRAAGMTYLIPPKLERFRLATGLPVFVDWKLLPHESTCTVEWYKRLQLAKRFYEATTQQECLAALPPILKRAEVTHIVVSRNADFLADCRYFRIMYSDQKHAVYSRKNAVSGKVSKAPSLKGARGLTPVSR